MTYATLVGSIAVHGLIIGLAFGAHAAVFMDVANPAVGATMFTAFMAMSNLAISYTNFWQGQVVQAFDYAMVLIPMCLIPFLRNREERSGAIPVRAD
jgi:glycogen synthase